MKTCCVWLALLCVLFSTTAWAQDDAPTAGDVEETVEASGTKVGGYAAALVGVTSVISQPGLELGSVAGVVLDDRVDVLLGIFDTQAQDEVADGDVDGSNNPQRKVELIHGGLIGAYAFDVGQTGTWRGLFQGMVGGGQIESRIDFPEGERISTAAYFVLEPGIQLEYHPLSWLGVGAVLRYRFIFAVEDADLIPSNLDLSGPSATLQLKFGFY